MIAELEIRKELARFLSNEIPLEEFEDWLVSRSWDMHQDSFGAAQKLASAIELRLAEYSSDHLSPKELRNELMPYATDINVLIPCGNTFVTFSGSSNVTATFPQAAWSLAATPAWGRPVGTSLEEEYA